MGLKRNKRGGRPSPYPRFLFHALRSAQLISSIVVMGIMSDFIYYLRLEQLSIPWTFINLLCVSIATLVALTITIVLYNFTYLAPKFNISLNSLIFAFWVLGLGPISSTVAKNEVLQQACTAAVWGRPENALICKDYKALWAMTLVATVSTLAALILDIQTHVKTTRRGAYTKPEDDQQFQPLQQPKGVSDHPEWYDGPPDLSLARTAILSPDTSYHGGYGERDVEGQAVPGGPLGHHEAK